jgi:hypothetical protein
VTSSSRDSCGDTACFPVDDFGTPPTLDADGVYLWAAFTVVDGALVPLAGPLGDQPGTFSARIVDSSRFDDWEDVDAGCTYSAELTGPTPPGLAALGLVGASVGTSAVETDCDRFYHPVDWSGLVTAAAGAAVGARTPEGDAYQSVWNEAYLFAFLGAGLAGPLETTAAWASGTRVDREGRSILGDDGFPVPIPYDEVLAALPVLPDGHYQVSMLGFALSDLTAP